MKNDRAHEESVTMGQQPPLTEQGALHQLHAEIEAVALSEEAAQALVTDPGKYLSERFGDGTAIAIITGILTGYFRVRMHKAVHGETYDVKRLTESLMAAQTIAIDELKEALFGNHGVPTIDQIIRISELLYKAGAVTIHQPGQTQPKSAAAGDKPQSHDGTHKEN